MSVALFTLYIITVFSTSPPPLELFELNSKRYYYV